MHKYILIVFVGCLLAAFPCQLYSQKGQWVKGHLITSTIIHFME